MGGGGHVLRPAARRARRRARAGDAVGHAGARRPARGARRARALRSVPARHPARVARARPATRRPIRASAPRSSTRPRPTRGPPSAWPASGGAAGGARDVDLGGHPRDPSAAGDGRGVRLQLATGIAAHRARSGAWGGGLWLPECAHAPWLDPLLEEAGVRAVCVDLTDVLGAPLRPLRSPAGPLLVPLDRPLLELVWSDAGYPSRGAYRDTHRLTPRRHQAWAVAGGAVRAGARAPRRRAPTRSPSWRRGGAGARRRRSRRLRSTPSCSACTGTRGRCGSPPCWRRRSAPACGSRRSTSCSARRIRPRRSPVTSWGAPRDLTTWSGPRAAGLAWRQRAAELRAVAAGPGVPARALRELLALQSSDWAFLATARTAGDYPLERATGHEAAFAAGAGGRRGRRRCAGSPRTWPPPRSPTP